MLSRRQAFIGVAAAVSSMGLMDRSQADEKQTFPARPPLGEGESTALASASDWLRQALLRDVRIFALGEERNFSVDQDTRTLTLVHADGLRLELGATLLASFNPHNGTFRWAWSNSSVDEEFSSASHALRRHPETIGFPSFSTPIFDAQSFEDCGALVALAARLSGYAGVYRAITPDHLSVFLGYMPPSDMDVARLWSAGRAAAEDESEALRLVEAYDAAMLPFDAEYAEFVGANADSDIHDDAVRRIEANPDVINDISRRQLETHRRFWRRSDNYWNPPLGWPSEHDPARRSLFFAAPRRAGDVYVVRGDGSLTPSAFVLRRFDDGMRIVDQDLDWGSALLLT
jgi:hypothetical protein